MTSIVQSNDINYRTVLTDRSGIIPLPLYTQPMYCGGQCIYCPREDGIPASYVKNEDTDYACRCEYSPEAQVERFLSRHVPSELSHKPFEIIVLGGSFSSLPRNYRLDFMCRLYNRMADVSGSFDRTSSWEASTHRCSVVTVESRPDKISRYELTFLRKLGVSKVEIGVQHTDDSVLNIVRRGHGQNEIKEATRLLKEEGFKVGYHIMPGLPGSKLAKDIQMVSSTLWQSCYSPDYLKVYPCVLLKPPSRQPALREFFKARKWQPMKDSDFRKVLLALWRNTPPYVRISRIQRLFSEQDVDEGPFSSFGRDCHEGCCCIRCREIGRLASQHTAGLAQLKLRILQRASDKYVLIEDQQRRLYGIGRTYDRMDGTVIIRELKVYGQANEIGAVGKVQGRGSGSLLVDKIENIAASSGRRGVFVNASYGAKSFFRKLGYEDSEGYLLRKPIYETA